MKPKFSPGAKVFAKVRGYPPWPARIEGCADETPKKEKYHVYFYGTGETAVVKIQDVFDFVENRNKMGKLKKLKNFTEAMQQVEGELTPEQKAAIKALDSEQTASPSVKDTEKGKDKESKDSETPKDKEKESKVDSSETIPAPSRRASTTNKTAKTTTPAASVKPVAKDNKRKLELDSSAEDPAPTPKKPNTAATPQSTSATSEKKDDKSQSKAAEPYSRSGRKIKPKKFTDFEDDDKEEQKVDSSPAKEDEKKPKEVRRPAPRPKSLKVPDDNADSGAGDWYLLARGQEPIKIPIKLNRPNFDDNKPRSITTSQWEDMVFEEARALKKRIENGEKFSEAAASDYMERFTKVKAATVHILRSPEEEEQFKKQTIDVETALLEVEFNIRNALTLKGADTKTCLQQLDKLKGLRVTALMLKKHSQIVHTMRKLRRYVGNPIVWNMNDDEMNEFNADAEKIRTKAEEIVNSFKTLFFQPHSVSFWDHFSNELAAFNAKTKHMSMEDVFSIITEPE